MNIDSKGQGDKLTHFVYCTSIGCICCTLRGDLLKTVKDLSGTGQFDYLVIESTGIGEPLPVAQTFVMDVDSMEHKHEHHHHHHHYSPEHGTTEQQIKNDDSNKTKKLTVATDEKNSLFHFAKLDTLVTVVDPFTIFDVLISKETLADDGNISGMIGNTGTGDDDVSASYPGGPEKMKSDKEACILAANNMPIERLHLALKSKAEVELSKVNLEI